MPYPDDYPSSGAPDDGECAHVQNAIDDSDSAMDCEPIIAKCMNELFNLGYDRTVDALSDAIGTLKEEAEEKINAAREEAAENAKRRRW